VDLRHSHTPVRIQDYLRCPACIISPALLYRGINLICIMYGPPIQEQKPRRFLVVSIRTSVVRNSISTSAAGLQPLFPEASKPSLIKEVDDSWVLGAHTSEPTAAARYSIIQGYKGQGCPSIALHKRVRAFARFWPSCPGPASTDDLLAAVLGRS
jgi:hypothetical protein